MRRSFVHFNRRDIRLRFPSNPKSPWFSEFQGEADGFDRPRFHKTRAVHGPAAEVESGDTIWLIGQLYAPWGDRLPATLDARIDVAAIEPRTKGPGYRFAAAATSRWFPLTNSTEYLESLNSRTSGQVVVPLWKNRDNAIGHYLRQMRKLDNDEPLREWERKLKSKSLHFISYRIRDGSHAAFDCAKHLLSEDTRVFWDRWSLPRRLAERREAVGDAPLDKTIEQSIHDADVVWGVESPRYGAPESYSTRERDLAKTLGKYCPLPVTRVSANKALHLDLRNAPHCFGQWAQSAAATDMVIK